MKKNQGFSLIELSIVILVIGVLISGVVVGSSIIMRMHLSAARTMTQSSPVSSIPNLTLWIDSVSEDSFDDSEKEEGSVITNWYDLNPQVSNKSNFIATNKPQYRNKAIGLLPAIKFNGTSNFMTSAAFPNITNASSIFMVLKTQSSVSLHALLAKRTPTSTNNALNLQFGIVTGTGASKGWQYCSNPAMCYYSAPSTSISASTNYIVAIVYSANSDSSTAIRFFQNGTQVASGNSVTTGYSPGVVSYSLYLGQSGFTSLPTYFGGHIGEVIVFDRALKNEERRSVEEYLSKKWKIAIS